MNRLLSACFLLCLLLPLFAANTNFNESSSYLAQIRASQEFDLTFRIAATLGVADMLEPEWDGADRQTSYGVMFDIGQKGWFANLAVDYHTSSGDGNNGTANVDGEISELDIGVRFYVEDKDINWGAYLGGGIAFISDELSIGNVTLSGDETGFWLNTGIYYIWNKQWYVGLDGRYSSIFRGFHENDLFDPTHFNYNILVGYKF